MESYIYRYQGPVMSYDKCVQENWEGETIAVSERKARNNLAYQWKKRNGYAPSFKVRLPEALIIVG